MEAALIFMDPGAQPPYSDVSFNYHDIISTIDFVGAHMNKSLHFGFMGNIYKNMGSININFGKIQRTPERVICEIQQEVINMTKVKLYYL